MTKFGIAAAIIVAFGMMFAAPASAHTDLLSSTPADGASVKELTQVTLVFSGKVMPSLARVQIRDASGGQHTAPGAPRVQGGTVTQAAAPDLKPGDYTIVYRVVADDGHPLVGKLSVKLIGLAPGEQGAAATAVASSSDPVANIDGPVAPAAKPSSTSSGGMKWLFVGGGLLIGVLIGMVIVVLRRRTPVPPAASADERPAGRAGDGSMTVKGEQPK